MTNRENTPPKTQPLAPACEHPSHKAENDHIQCVSCRAVRTDWGPDWGVAGGGKWFRSLHEAKFYRDNGRLPDPVPAPAASPWKPDTSPVPLRPDIEATDGVPGEGEV